jgi:hypothetical protein
VETTTPEEYCPPLRWDATHCLFWEDTRVKNRQVSGANLYQIAEQLVAVRKHLMEFSYLPGKEKFESKYDHYYQRLSDLIMDIYKESYEMIDEEGSGKYYIFTRWDPFMLYLEEGFNRKQEDAIMDIYDTWRDPRTPPEIKRNLDFMMKGHSYY